MKRRHHTTADWDFSAATWILDNAQFVSAPSSFRTNGGQFLRVLVKVTVVPIANVKQGRFETYFRVSEGGGLWKAHIYLIFRYQDANNYYYAWIHRDLTTLRFYRVQAGVPTLLDSAALGWAKNTWHRVRVTWWNDAVGLVIRFERYQAGSWVTIEDAYDPLNLWENIGGRVGFYFHGAGAPIFSHWFDDTIIYGVL